MKSIVTGITYLYTRELNTGKLIFSTNIEHAWSGNGMQGLIMSPVPTEEYAKEVLRKMGLSDIELTIIKS